MTHRRPKAYLTIRKHLRGEGALIRWMSELLVDTLGLMIGNRVELADTSDRRAGPFVFGSR